jgi:predicted N-acetyltransferase YhbS
MSLRSMPAASPGWTVRAMRPDDLDAVAGLDAEASGRRRGAYFAARLEAALRAPAQHVQLAAVDGDGGLAGFLLHRIETGEFGGLGRVAALEAVAVSRARRGAGIGTALLAAARAVLARKGIAAETTRADWRNHALLAFLDRAGFLLAPRQILSFDLARPRAEIDGDAAAFAAAGIQAEPPENDYGRDPAPQAAPLARDLIPVRSMRPGDFAAVLRIDRNAVGRERDAYIRAKMAEALDRPGVRVSLIADVDGVAAGFVMASVEFGAFGRTEPASVLDTIGVDPGFRRQGVARALLSQLAVNLRGLGLERIETEVAREQFDLLALFYGRGFAPAQRLAFHRALG